VATECIGADSVDLKIETNSTWGISRLESRLLHLQTAHGRVLVRVQIVCSPVMGESQRPVELQRSEPRVIADA
jgi:hypothetical protein